MILTTMSQAEMFMGDNFGLILTAVVMITLLATYIFNKIRTAKEKNGPEGTTIAAIQDTVNSMFSEDRIRVLIEQCVEDALSLIVKGSTKEQFEENIKDNVCDCLYNFVQTEYPMYKVICSRDNIERLADVIIDNFGFNKNKIESLYNEQINHLTDNSEE